MAAGEGDEKQDLLPDVTGDELRKKLSAFDSQIKTLGLNQQSPQKRNPDGAAPKPPAPDAASKDAVWKQALAALNAGNMDEYNTLYAKYLNMP